MVETNKEFTIDARIGKVGKIGFQVQSIEHQIQPGTGTKASFFRIGIYELGSPMPFSSVQVQRDFSEVAAKTTAEQFADDLARTIVLDNSTLFWGIQSTDLV